MEHARHCSRVSSAHGCHPSPEGRKGGGGGGEEERRGEEGRRGEEEGEEDRREEEGREERRGEEEGKEDRRGEEGERRRGEKGERGGGGGGEGKRERRHQPGLQFCIPPPPPTPTWGGQSPRAPHPSFLPSLSPLHAAQSPLTPDFQRPSDPPIHPEPCAVPQPQSLFATSDRPRARAWVPRLREV